MYWKVINRIFPTLLSFLCHRMMHNARKLYSWSEDLDFIKSKTSILPKPQNENKALEFELQHSLVTNVQKILHSFRIKVSGNIFRTSFRTRSKSLNNGSTLIFVLSLVRFQAHLNERRQSFKSWMQTQYDEQMSETSLQKKFTCLPQFWLPALGHKVSGWRNELQSRLHKTSRLLFQVRTFWDSWN